MSRLNLGMTPQEAVMTMCNGNPGCIKAMCEMLNANPGRAVADFIVLDSLGIYGSKIYMIWNDCCNRDIDKLFQTMDAFQAGKFSKEEIHKNLDQIRAKPFI